MEDLKGPENLAQVERLRRAIEDAIRIEHGRQRKVYTLTRRGEHTLQQARTQLQELVEEVMEGGKGHARS